MSELPSVRRPDLRRRYCNGKTITRSAFRAAKQAPAIGRGRFQRLLDVDISTPCGGFGAEELTNHPLRPTDTTGCGDENSIGYFWCEYSAPRLSSSDGPGVDPSIFSCFYGLGNGRTRVFEHC